jgi:hypothetical protein
MARRNLENAVEERACLMSTEFKRVIDGLAIPTRRDSCREKSFDFRSKIEPTLVECIEERLDAEAVTGGEDGLVYAVPKHEGELSPQSVEAISTELFIKMKNNFAV